MIEALKQYFDAEDWDIREVDGQTMAYMDKDEASGPIDINLTDLARFLEGKVRP